MSRKQEIARLFSNAEDLSQRVFQQADAVGLPDPVQRYLRYAVDEGHSYISLGSSRQTGWLRPGLDPPTVPGKGPTLLHGQAARPHLVREGQDVRPARFHCAR
jgi:hypothetical protein